MPARVTGRKNMQEMCNAQCCDDYEKHLALHLCESIAAPSEIKCANIIEPDSE